jgi:cytochrome c biogenesis protein ResB
MRNVLKRILRFFSSLGLAVVLLLFLGLLTWLGTLEQVEHGLYDVQKKYFESFFLVHDSGLFPIPLPGANLVLCLLGANLILGGMVRLRKGWDTAGVLVTHVGIALLLVSGLIKMYHSEEGHVSLFEGQSSDFFQSYHRWEIVAYEDLGDGTVRTHVAPQEAWAEAAGGKATLSSEDLPFDVELTHLMRNCAPLPKGPMFEVDVPVVDGVFLREAPVAKENEQNFVGLYATVVADGARQDGILWGRELAPWTFEVGGRRFALDLRHERYPMPFNLRLDQFTKLEHARTTLPRHFSSDVTVTESGIPRSVHIKMNEPLRDEGLVVYQASWGPPDARPGEPLYSTLAVVRNPADQYPLYACIVIATGLILHFGRKLFRYIRIEAKTS